MISNALFDIIDNSGASFVYDLHPTQKVIAYESGCYITLWDLEIDKKLMIHPHENTVTLIKFFGPNNQYLLSVDNGYKPSVYVTEWSSMTRVHQLYLPTQRKNEYVKSYNCSYSNKNELLILVENYNDHYSFNIWDFKSRKFILVAQGAEENQENCVGIHLLEDAQNFYFAIAEKKTVKYWKYEKQRIELLHKIHIKEEIVDTTVSNLAQFFLFTTKQGRLYIINKEGQLVSTLKHPVLSYSCLCLNSDCLFLGSLEGEIEVYQLSSMKLIKTLKNLPDLIKSARSIRKSNIHSSNEVYQFKKESIDKIKSFENRNLVQISIAKKNNTLSLRYIDSNIFVFDLDKEKVIGSVTGHCKKIQETIWEISNKKTFITCSNDGTIRVWNYIGDRWDSYAIYPPLSGLQTSSFTTFSNRHLNRNDNSLYIKESFYKITCIQVDWINKEIFAGDNQGCLNVYSFLNGEVKRHIKVGGFKIKKISLGSLLIGLAFSNGTCIVMERQKSFECQQLKLEEPVIDLGKKQKYCLGIKLVENDNHSNIKNEKFQRENPLYRQSKYDTNVSYVSESYSSMKETTQRVITVHNTNTLRLHQVTKSQSYLNSIVLATYNVQGRVLDFALHVSNDYLLVLTNENVVYIFKIASGEVKGRIEMPKLSKKIILDPSGLYVIVASPFISSEITGAGIQFEKSVLSVNSYPSPSKEHAIVEKSVNKDQNVLSLFEIWTGEYLGQIHRLQSISSLAFSYEGTYLCVGSSEGILTILTIDENLRENIYEALEGLHQNSYFWSDFQLEFGEKKLLPESLSQLPDFDKDNTSFEQTAKEIYLNSQDISKSFVRPPQSFVGSERSNELDQRGNKSKDLNRSPDEKIPTMKKFAENKKNHTSLTPVIHQKSSPQAILITGGDHSRADKSQQISRFILPNASFQARQDRARDRLEQIRAVNFGRKENVSENENDENDKRTRYLPFQQHSKQTSKYIGPVDKIIDLVSAPNEIEKAGIFRAIIESRRNIQSDPSDIDDEPDYHHYNKETEERKHKDVEYAQSENSKNAVDDVSDMYDDISDFERRFHREDVA